MLPKAVLTVLVAALVVTVIHASSDDVAEKIVGLFVKVENGNVGVVTAGAIRLGSTSRSHYGGGDDYGHGKKGHGKKGHGKGGQGGHGGYMSYRPAQPTMRFAPILHASSPLSDFFGGAEQDGFGKKFHGMKGGWI